MSVKSRWQIFSPAKVVALALVFFITSSLPTFATDFSYTGSVQTFTAPGVGVYQLEVWGAQGGTLSSKIGGAGGYSIGNVRLNTGDVLSIYVGGQGSIGTAGYNGGGGAGSSGAGGGGATDIRLNGTTLSHRLIVAGGGGGAGQDSCATAGFGGGTAGGGAASQGSCGTQGGGGSQTAGGAGGIYSGTTGATGTFGVGATAADGSYDGGGGGGGWYGGGAGASAGWSNGAGGGSGYVYTASTAVNYPNCQLSTSYYLTSASTIAGDSSFPAPAGGTETGHTGNGFAKITFLDSTPPSGGSISYSTGPITKSNQTFNITVNDGTDSESGIDTSSRQLLISRALLTKGTCGTFSSFSPVSYTGTYPNITTSGFTVDSCYKFSWSVSDIAGNTTTYTADTIVTTSSNTISLSQAPLGTVIRINNLLFTKVNNSGLLLALQVYPRLLATTGSCNTPLYDLGPQTLASGATHATYSNNTASIAGTHTVTVTANPTYAFSDGTTSKTLSCLISPAPTLQAFTTADCTALPTCAIDNCPAGATTTLTDSRDSKTYRIRKFADGHCWMIDNLRYGGSTDACAGKTSFSGNGSATPTNTFGTGTYGDCRDSGNTSYGYYYNWQAAMQHSTAYYNSSYTGPVIATGICPTGWHVPTSMDYRYLDVALGGYGGYSTTSMTVNPVANWLSASYFNGLLSGCCNTTGSLDDQGTSGSYWSGTQGSADGAYDLYFDSANVNPGVYNSDRGNGLAVRCIKD